MRTLGLTVGTKVKKIDCVIFVSMDNFAKAQE